MRPARADAHGAALVIAMLLAAIATSIVAGLLWHQQLWLRQYDYGRDQAQALALARSGIDWSRLILQEDARTSSIDHFGEQWAIRLPPTRLETGEIGGGIVDQQGLFNLNSLVRDGRVVPDALARYRRLLALLDLPQELAPTLADWLDAKTAASPGGAEDGYYLALDPPRLSANRPLVTTDELALVAGYRPEYLRRLLPLVSALPPEAGAAVNVNTAPPEVLAAMVENLPLQDANRLAAERLARPFASVAEFRSRIPGAGNAVNELTLRVTSAAFVVRVDVRQGEVRATGSALVLRDGTDWPRVIWQMIE
jgi:general secretion pathway protein K